MMSPAAGRRNRLFVLTVLVLTLGACRAEAQPPPDKYRVQLRYRIAAGRDQHVIQYDALIAHLKAAGFQFDPALDQLPETDREDRAKNVLTGVIAAAKVPQMLDSPSAAAALLVPLNYKLPEQPEQLVRVRLELASGFNTAQQQLLARQVRAKLQEITQTADKDAKAPPGFQEGLGYDHRGFTRLMGTIPAGQLELLLRDLRRLPAGWFGP